LHNDFKNSNVVFRNYDDEPQEFVFELEQRGKYKIRTRQIPVVIDFDFASVLVTQNRSNAGTNYTQAPEILIVMFLNHIGRAKRQDIGINEDWWSLGMTLYYWWTGSWCSKDVPRSLMRLYAREIADAFDVPYEDIKDKYWGENTLNELFRVYCITIQLEIPLVKHADKRFFSSEYLEYGAKYYMRKNPIFLDNFQLGLLQRLLSWNYRERDYHGEPWKLITEHFEVDSNAGTADYFAPLDPLKEQPHRDMYTNYDELSHQMICIQCGQWFNI
jgi:serine/threonine protein kinase